jgi:long-subunit fatty acid transport protein
VLPAALAAQSSQFGIRGLGYPNSAYSGRARAMGGAAALFDPESGVNPASLAYLTEMTASFSLIGDRRTVESPAGSGNVRNMRFPLFSIASPLRQVPITFGIGVSTYLARDFSSSFRDTVDIRGIPTETIDTLTSVGGISDLHATVVWRIDPRTAVGTAIHAFTGVERITRVRYFQDTGYVSIQESSEVSAAGAGFDVGFIKRLSARLSLAGVLRSDGHLSPRRDSLTATEFPVDLPFSAAFGAQWRPSPRVTFDGQARWQGWGSADADLTAVGSTGANDTWEVGFGGELVRHLDRPARYPIRFGVRHLTLPFPLVTGGHPSETAASVGTGMTFRDGMGGLDASFERVWRSEGSAFTERAWLFSLTASLRPNRRTR